MATKADFTDEEWQAMQKGVTGAGMLVSVGDRDFTDSFGEAKTLAKHLGELRQTGESEFLRDLAATRKSGFGLTDSPQEVEDETLQALRDSIATLGAKAPDEVDAYRGVVLGVARAVAEAKGGVAAGETAAIEKIAEALGTTA